MPTSPDRRIATGRNPKPVDPNAMAAELREEMRAERRRRGISLSVLARELCVNRGTLSRFETGRTKSLERIEYYHFATDYATVVNPDLAAEWQRRYDDAVRRERRGTV
ncbi:Helix-turn-helix [Lentzea fradiae]|uniref:Helix-turn-helix n=1 Tax=Lentzea fradiae TaxID=200378 RepID=A0A1G8CUU6_9PSEU|nr:helix-turn-helix transcriptional regulator [Lentzea fradiae]SDH48993.1 Helix-turn-helix [Lentzea fradiae]